MKLISQVLDISDVSTFNRHAAQKKEAAHPTPPPPISMLGSNRVCQLAKLVPGRRPFFNVILKLMGIQH